MCSKRSDGQALSITSPFVPNKADWLEAGIIQNGTIYQYVTEQDGSVTVTITGRRTVPTGQA